MRGRAGRLIAIGAVGLLTLVLGAADLRTLDRAAPTATAFNRDASDPSVAVAAPSPRLKASSTRQQRARHAALVAGVAAALVAATLGATLLGTSGTNRVRHPNWRRAHSRAPPALAAV